MKIIANSTCVNAIAAFAGVTVWPCHARWRCHARERGYGIHTSQIAGALSFPMGKDKRADRAQLYAAAHAQTSVLAVHRRRKIERGAASKKGRREAS